MADADAPDHDQTDWLRTWIGWSAPDRITVAGRDLPADLMGRLHFSTRDGRIWLDDQRMLLIHAKALGLLRREMIEMLGMDVARGLMTRMGYHAGAQDAQMARKVRSKTSLQDMFVVGPQMHCLEGIGLSEAVRLGSRAVGCSAPYSTKSPGSREGAAAS